MTKSILIFIAGLMVSGCVSNLTGETYSREDARKVQKVQLATVVSSRPVVIEGTRSKVGAMVGAVVGGIAGSGEGKAGDIGATLGATAGGVVGEMVEERATRAQGIEITVKLENGKVFSVVQEAGKEVFVDGEQVKILKLRGKTRVAH